MSTTRAPRLDPDELALLEEERDHLLVSLEDLEREYAAGDMDEVDYLALKDDYTVRAAEVLEAIEARHSLIRGSQRPVNRGRTALVAVAVLAFAVLAGVLVARGSGQRGDGTISGAINNLRADLARCQAASFKEPRAGVECYDEILADAPDNVEALTYQGWAQIRDDQVREGAANLDRAAQLDPGYPDVRVFRAIVAARGGDHAKAAQEIDHFYRNNPSPASVQILQSQGLEREIFVRLLDAPTRDCWVEAAGSADTSGSGEAAGSAKDSPEQGAGADKFLGSLAGCLDRLLASQPEDTDALVSRTYALLAPGTAPLADGRALVERALAADPDNPNALLMRAAIALVDDRPADAAADLDTLDKLPRPTISFLIGGPEQLRASLKSQQPDPQAPGTTTAPGQGSSGATIPNPDGG